MTCFIDLNLFYIIIEIFNIKSLATSIIPELPWFVKNVTFDNSTNNVVTVTDYNKYHEYPTECNVSM
jgi:hypothetical protein